MQTKGLAVKLHHAIRLQLRFWGSKCNESEQSETWMACLASCPNELKFSLLFAVILRSSSNIALQQVAVV